MDDLTARPVFAPVDRRLPGGDLQGLLAVAAHSSTASIMVTDAELDSPGPSIMYVNPAFEAMTGYAAENVVGRSPRFLQGPATDMSVLARLRRDLDTSGYFTGEAINYRADGSPFVMAWQIRALMGPDGRPSHYVAIQSDATSERMRDHAERRAGAELQKELLPIVSPRVGCYEVVTRYESAETELSIGGDWYDALELPSGQVAFVVGDVAGHGVSAAAAMGRLRWSIRSLLVAGVELADVVRHARDFACADDTFATVAIVIVDGSASRARIVTLGHPPVMLWSGSTVRSVWTENPLLGIAHDEMVTETVAVGPDEMIVLYTDGVLAGGRREPEWLVDVLGELAGDGETTLSAMADALVGRVVVAGSDDDSALLLARTA
ncbi:MAG: PP2C family protein-serine/threonine phosphatase [Acidimicrobiales bacterium]